MCLSSVGTLTQLPDQTLAISQLNLAHLQLAQGQLTAPDALLRITMLSNALLAGAGGAYSVQQTI